MITPDPSAPRLVDYAADAHRVFDVLRKGGVAIVPATTGYALMGSSKEAVMRMFNHKRRAATKVTALGGNRSTVEQVQILGEEQKRVVEAITRFYQLPLGVIAPVRYDHPIFSGVDDAILDQSRRDGTMLTLINGGALNDEMAELSLRHNVAYFGSSANISTQGTRFRLQDIEPEIRAIADIEIDYGPSRWIAYGKSSTIIDFRDYKVVRAGIAFEQIQYLAQRHFNITLKAPEAT